MLQQKRQCGILGLLLLALMWSPAVFAEEERGGVFGAFVEQVLACLFEGLPEASLLPDDEPGPLSEAGPNPPVIGLTGPVTEAGPSPPVTGLTGLSGN